MTGTAALALVRPLPVLPQLPVHAAGSGADDARQRTGGDAWPAHGCSR
jgi:hypothetical protein